MNMKLLKLLAILSGVLCVIIAGEWFYAIYAKKQLLQTIQTVDKKKNTPVKLPTIELTQKPESGYVDLVARPLFIQGRRPVAEPASTSEVKPVSTASQNFNWALNGVYTRKNSLYALISRTTTKVPKDNFRKVTKDNEVDGWKITEIHKDKLIVTQADQRKELPLHKPKPKTAINPSLNDPLISPNVPGEQPPQPLMPGQQPQQMIPGQETQPVPIPEPVPQPEMMPEPEVVPQPELIPEESSETYFENNPNEQQFQ